MRSRVERSEGRGAGRERIDAAVAPRPLPLNLTLSRGCAASGPVRLMAAVLLAGGASAFSRDRSRTLTAAARAKCGGLVGAAAAGRRRVGAVDAAKAGDVARYLTLFARAMPGATGAIARRWARPPSATTWCDRLPPKGIAISPLDDGRAPPGPARPLPCRVRLRRPQRGPAVYAAARRERWQIANVDSAERIKTYPGMGRRWTRCSDRGRRVDPRCSPGIEIPVWDYKTRLRGFKGRRGAEDADLVYLHLCPFRLGNVEPGAYHQFRVDRRFTLASR